MKHDNITEVCVPTADNPGIYEHSSLHILRPSE